MIAKCDHQEELEERIATCHRSLTSHHPKAKKTVKLERLRGLQALCYHPVEGYETYGCQLGVNV